MMNIANKFDSLRTARAMARLNMPDDVLSRVREQRVEQGDCLEVGRVTGIQAAKHTASAIPFCHNLPLHAVDISYEFSGQGIEIYADVASLAPTAVEMEAMAAASTAALTIYGMLKMYCRYDQMEIGAVRLLQKTGGKRQFRATLPKPRAASVIVLSDSVAAGQKPDTAGKAVVKGLEAAGFSPVHYQILPDEPAELKQALQAQLEADTPLILTVGGTGIGPRDKTVETVKPLLSTEMPGIMEAARAYGQRRTPYSMMSRGVAGLVGKSLVVTFPGSRGGASDSLHAVLPGLIHVFDALEGGSHAGGYQ